MSSSQRANERNGWLFVPHAQAHDAPLFQLNLSRALDLQERRFDRVVHPDNFLPLKRRTADQLRARRQRLAAPRGRHAVQRRLIGAVAGARATQQRFVVTGDEAAVGAVVLHDPIRREVVFKKHAHGNRITGIDHQASGAHARPIGAALHRLAVRLQRGPGGGEVIGGPAGHISPGGGGQMPAERACWRLRRFDAGRGPLVQAASKATTRTAASPPQRRQVPVRACVNASKVAAVMRVSSCPVRPRAWLQCLAPELPAIDHEPIL